ncbi:centrosomal protein of 120 kDa [Trichonephila inaurata madagascariensis]|uniref:Centrosomal protein of 120 kDa n=1 Tax=Trichonephila inaurata madagascariensis TaxID=2747483 RepID=A0A8X6YJ18_9ARAC|nr:centrosomal protein of 120 kDa [Trichonephila inaurata madagascariensis]
MTTNYIIVISILEGKNFPTRHDKYLLVEAKFDGEVMSTDPAAHIMRPHFNTELAWEVDKKGLQMHRLQRSPIKLQWYAVDLDLTKKETIGYMIIDVRLAQEKLQSPKWYPLLNSKYQKEKPEVLLSLYLERVVEEVPPSLPNGHSTYSSRRNSLSQDRNGSKKQPIGPRVIKPPSVKVSSHTPNTNSVLKPILLSQAGCYQIGPPELCNEKYVFSVTLAFAANLNKLTPPAMLKSSKGFFFYYSLFDNDVITEKFSSLSNPDFLAERASVRISSSPNILSEYFEQNSSLEILLCCGDISLGSGQIPLGPLSCVNNHDVNQEPLCIEGSVQIMPTEKTSRSGGDDLSPFVGVTVVLQADKAEEENGGHKENSSPVQENNISHEKSQAQNFSAMTLKKNQSFVQKSFSKNEENLSSHDGQGDKISGSRPENSNPIHNSVPNDPSSGSYNHSSDNSPPEVRDPGNIISSPPNSLPIKNDNSAHHFSFSLDLCNFKATRLAHPINLFIRYSYPFFGTTSSMVTHPDVEVNPKREISIPHGYCAFNFATTFALLKSTFWETPLILEVLHRKKGGQEQLVGTARINLFQVTDAACVSHSVDKKQGMRQMSTCKVVVTSPEGYEIGEIYAALTLIDFGPTSALCDHHSNKSSISCYNEVRSYVPNFNVPLLRQNGLTQDELLQAALELELWQERQRELFRAQLKDKEMQHLSVLTSEWKQRDMERELLLQRQLQECKKLEDKLKATLKDAELKEKQLSAQETELSLRLQKLDEQREQQKKEAKHQIESIKMEFNELLTLERLSVRELEQKNGSLMKKVKELEKELQEQRIAADNLKSQANKDPDVQLRTEVNILNMEKAELQQKLETALASKQKYKYQWSQSVRQISALQQKLHMMECLEKEKKEKLASFQQRMLSAEEKNAIQTNEDILDMVNEKVQGLKSVMSPENIQQQMRQMSLAMHGTETVPTSSMCHTRPSPNTMMNKIISNGPILNSIAKCITSIANETGKQNSNVSVSTPNEITGLTPSPEQSSPNVNQLPSKSSISKPTKDIPDLNGNTTAKDTNLHIQHLLAEKESLLIRGYTEQDKLIKELNTHIEKAKNGFK